MVETKGEIQLAGRDGAWAAVQSTAQGDAAKQAEILLFCHYAVRVLRRVTSGESRAPLVQALEALEDASSEEAVRLVEEAGANLRNLGHEATTDAGKRVVFAHRLLNGSRSPRLHLSAQARGFRVLRKGLDDAFSRSLLVLFSSLAERRAGDTVYVRRLAKAGGSVGRLARADPAVLANEVALALAAADVGWRVDVDENIFPESRYAGMQAAGDFGISCPACTTRTATTPADRSFDTRLWPDRTATLAKCRHCGSGVWARDGAARVIAPEAWSAMESIRSWLLDETEQRSSVSLFDKLKAVLTEEGWSFSQLEPMPVLLTEVDGPSGRWKLYAHVVEERDLILFYSICPLTVPPEKRAEMASFLTRANYGLALGNFELDFEDGEIRYKTSLTVEAGDVSPALVRRLAHVNGLALERYLPSIAAVVTGTPALPDLEEQPGA